MSDLLLDSDVIIEHLRGNQAVDSELESLKNGGWSLFYTPIAKAEIYHGLKSGEESATEQLFAVCRCLAITDEIGERAGRYLATYNKSHGIGIADALVAAAARVHRATLFTLNLRHYPMKDIRIHRLIGHR